MADNAEQATTDLADVWWRVRGRDDLAAFRDEQDRLWTEHDAWVAERERVAALPFLPRWRERLWRWWHG